MNTDILFELLDARGVSGSEGDVRKIIENAVKPMCDDVYTDTMGNLFAHKKGRGGSNVRVMACAHMDEVGMMVSWFRDDGLLEYETVGSIDPRMLASKRVTIGEARVPGVIGVKAIHLQSEDEYHSTMGHDRLRIDIGAPNAEEAKKSVKLGDYAAFDTQSELFGDNCICGKAIDSRSGCLALIEALRYEYDCDFTAVFSVQEKIGLRGAMITCARVHPDICIVLDGADACDLGDVEEHLRVSEVGKGVALSFMDDTALADMTLFRRMLKLARANSIPCQIKTSVIDMNDAGAIQRREGAVSTCVLSVPCRNMDSPVSAASMDDIQAECNLLRIFLEST